MSNNPIMILNGAFVAEKNAAISPVNRGMMYGDGCFETIRLYAGKLLGWQSHFDRLKAGLQYLEMEVNFSADDLRESISKLVDKNQFSDKDTMVRIQCWRSGGRGYNPTSTQTNWMAQISEISISSEPMELTVANTRCIPHEALQRRYKLTNGLNYIKAAQEADARKADDALMLTIDEQISETTSANIFWIKGGAVFTPHEDCDLLPGVTRSIMMNICERLTISLKKGSFSLSDLQDAEAVFCTNSLIEIREVSSVDKMKFEIGHPITKKIKAGFEAYKKEHIQ